jgi:hypothetical protein
MRRLIPFPKTIKPNPQSASQAGSETCKRGAPTVGPRIARKTMAAVTENIVVAVVWFRTLIRKMAATRMGMRNAVIAFVFS